MHHPTYRTLCLHNISLLDCLCLLWSTTDNSPLATHNYQGYQPLMVSFLGYNATIYEAYATDQFNVS